MLLESEQKHLKLYYCINIMEKVPLTKVSEAGKDFFHLLPFSERQK